MEREDFRDPYVRMTLRLDPKDDEILNRIALKRRLSRNATLQSLLREEAQRNTEAPVRATLADLDRQIRAVKTDTALTHYFLEQILIFWLDVEVEKVEAHQLQSLGPAVAERVKRFAVPAYQSLLNVALSRTTSGVTPSENALNVVTGKRPR